MQGIKEPEPSVDPAAMARTGRRVHLGLTHQQAALADLLRDINASLVREADPEQPYSEFFASENHARFAWTLNNLGRVGQPFPGDKPMPRRRRTRGSTKFQRVKNALRVEDIASDFTELRMVSEGKMKGLCPIHDERTPSFRLDLDRQTWRCFGACARGGDVIALAQELMNRGKL